MTAITAMPDILMVVEGNYRAFKEQAAQYIYGGQVVTLNSTGLLIPVPVATGSGTPNAALGVALDDTPAYERCTVVYQGIVTVANGTSTAAITVGQSVKTGGTGGYPGCVVAATVGTDTCIVGVAIDSTGIPVSSTGRILLKPYGQYYK